jgi:DnaK suppressor protein
MTKQERQRLIEKISAEINILKKFFAVMEESVNLLSPEGPDNRISLRAMIKMKSADERELRFARVRLNKLESAFKKIDDPEFGTCFICEQPIPLARLLAVPETTRCVKCEEE